MQQQAAIQISQLRHQENGGATAHNHPSSLIDRLLLPMFSMQFSANALQDPEHVLELKTAGKGGKMGFSMMDGYIKLSEEVDNSVFKKNGENPSGSCKKRENGLTKFCARGHWKPSEDAKLRELVAVHGPQNWNLIAEKLEGRSGNYKHKMFLLFSLKITNLYCH